MVIVWFICGNVFCHSGGFLLGWFLCALVVGLLVVFVLCSRLWCLLVCFGTVDCLVVF